MPTIATLRNRLYCRAPLVGDWIRRRALRRLILDPSPAAIEILAEIALESPYPAIRESAVQTLTALARAANAEAQEKLCQLFVYEDCPGVRTILVKNGLSSRDPATRALQHCLLGQWEQYEALDFDQSLLSAAYTHASPSLRERIVRVARDAGRLDIIRAILQRRPRSGIHARTDDEWRAALRLLWDQRRWDELWRLVHEAPPRWGSWVMQGLEQAHWTGPSDERAHYRNLVRLARSWRHRSYRADLTCRAVLTGHKDEVRCLAFVHEGQMLASAAGDGALCLWDIPDGKLRRSIQAHSGAVQCMTIRPDGRGIATGGKDCNIWIWEVPGGSPLGRIEGHARSISSMLWSGDGQILASASADGMVRLWDPHDGRLLATLDEHAGSVLDMAFCAGGRTLATTGADCTVRLWDVTTGKSRRILSAHRAQQMDAVLCLATDPGGELLAAGGTDGHIGVWQVPSGNLIYDLTAHSGSANCLVFADDGATLVSGGDDRHVCFWSMQDGVLRKRIEAQSGPVARLAVNAVENCVASACGYGAGQDASIRLWNLSDGAPIESLYGHSRYINALACTANGAYLASGGGDRTIRLWSAELHRVANQEISEATFGDLEVAERQCQDQNSSDDERSAWAFVTALLRWRHRHDVMVEDLKPAIEVGEFDIEIEG